MSRKLTIEEFINKARNVHGDKYDYSKVVYKDNKTKVCIICHTHGEFYQRPNDHMNGNGCPICSGRTKNTTEEFVKKAKYVHNNYFDYGKTEYVSANKKITVTCPIHGDFNVKANNHLTGHNCPKCSNEGITHVITKLPTNGNNTRKITQEDAVARIHDMFGNKYKTDEVKYINNVTKIKLYCIETDEYGVEHGVFYITPSHLFSGQGCPKCGKNHRLTTEEFIQRSNLIHDNTYCYDKSVYKSTHRNLTITCPVHGDFRQSPANHLRGQGCPKCDISLLENEIYEALIKNNINFVQQTTFTWLRYEKNLFLDFYLPDYNIAIECQGEQHFRPVSFSRKMNGETLFIINKKRDTIKHDLCVEHGIDILYYSKTKIEYQYQIYNNIEKLIQKINENKKT